MQREVDLLAEQVSAPILTGFGEIDNRMFLALEDAKHKPEKRQTTGRQGLVLLRCPSSTVGRSGDNHRQPFPE